MTMNSDRGQIMLCIGTFVLSGCLTKDYFVSYWLYFTAMIELL